MIFRPPSGRSPFNEGLTTTPMGTQQEVFRFERKFVVTEAAADSIQQFVSAYLDFDEHMAGQDLHGYRVCSLYLDTPDLAFYRQSKEGVKNRRKLRIRIYDDRPEGLAFLEIKKRTGETVHKLRATVRKSACQSMLRGDHLSSDDLQSMSDVGMRALDEFCEFKEHYDADGVVYVDYRARRVRFADGRQLPRDFRSAAGEPTLLAAGWTLSAAGVEARRYARSRAGVEVQRPGAAVDARSGANVQSAAMFVSEIRLLCGRARRRAGELAWLRSAVR